MEVHFTPELERKLTELAAQSGRGLDELVQDVMAGYADEFAKRAKCSNPATTRSRAAK